MRREIEILEQKVTTQSVEITSLNESLNRSKKQSSQIEKEYGQKHSQLKRQFQSKLDQNRQFTLELQNRNKRLHKLQRQHSQDRKNTSQKDQRLHDLTKQITYLMKSNESLNEKIVKYEQDSTDYKIRQQGLRDELYNARASYKQSQKKLDLMHQEKVARTENNAKKFEQYQSNHQVLLQKLAQQTQNVESLTQKLAKITQANNALQYAFQERMQNLLGQKDDNMRRQRANFEKEIKECKEQYREEIKNVKKQCGRDVISVIDNLKQKQSEYKGVLERQKRKYQNIRQQLESMGKELEECNKEKIKNQAIVEELREIVRVCEGKLKKAESENVKQKQGINQELFAAKERIAVIQEENLKLKKDLQQMGQKAQQLKAQSLATLQKINQITKQSKIDKQKSLKNTQTIQKYESQREKILIQSEMKTTQINDLKFKLQTQQKMMQDQNEVIGALKSNVKQRDIEIESLREKKQQNQVNVITNEKLRKQKTELINENQKILQELQKNYQVEKALVQNNQKQNDQILEQRATIDKLEQFKSNLMNQLKQIETTIPALVQNQKKYESLSQQRLTVINEIKQELNRQKDAKQSAEKQFKQLVIQSDRKVNSLKSQNNDLKNQLKFLAEQSDKQKKKFAAELRNIAETVDRS